MRDRGFANANESNEPAFVLGLRFALARWSFPGAGDCPDFLDPGLILQVPSNRLLQAVTECITWVPAQFLSDLRRIDCIAAVMSGPIRHKGYRPAGDANYPLLQLVEKVADQTNQF